MEWTNLERVWVPVGNRDAFVRYVQCSSLPLPTLSFPYRSAPTYSQVVRIFSPDAETCHRPWTITPTAVCRILPIRSASVLKPGSTWRPGIARTPQQGARAFLVKDQDPLSMSDRVC